MRKFWKTERTVLCAIVGGSSKEQASSYLHSKNSNGVYDDAAHYTSENGRSL